jgi:hypothetical protein
VESNSETRPLSANGISFLLYFIPSAYFFRSRFTGIGSVIFHAFYEWIPGIIALNLFTANSLSGSIYAYIQGFLAFISLYEIGYFVNDYYSVKKEDAGRVRIKDFNMAEEWEVLLLIFSRIAFFFLWLYFLEIGTLTFLFFSFLLAFSFAAHNLLKDPALKILTFINLAMFRFLLPVVPFIQIKQLRIIIPAVLLNYVFYRAINYMESKAILNIKNRKTGLFKMGFYLLLMPGNLFLSVVFESYYPLIFNVMLVVLWGSYWGRERLLPA